MTYNEPLKEFLKEYTETAAIEKLDLPKTDFPTDKDGFISVPSSDDILLTFSMRNPQLYLLNFSLGLEDSGSARIADKYNGTAYSFKQSEDLLQVTLNFTQDYLYELECGGNLSANVNLLEPNTGRSFEPYAYKLKVNTPPEPVRNLVVLQDSSTNNYVLAMNMPDMSGIHRDISAIKINGASYSLSLPSNPSQNDIGIDLSNNAAFTTSYNPAWIAGVAGTEFEGTGSQRVLYYKTNTAISTDEIFFTVNLEDANGLSVESKVSERSKKLEKVIYSEGYSNLDTDEDGYASFTINASPNCTDGSSSDGGVTVYYKIYNYDESAPDHKGVVKKQGSGIDSVTVKLTNGKWICESWSHKIGYIDSTVNTGNLAVQGFVFVKPSYSGSVSDGGKETPYKSIEEAIAGVAGLDSVKIYLLEDVSLKAPLILTKSMEVKSPDGFKVHGNITVPRNYVLTINDKAFFDYIYVKEGGLIKTREIAVGTNAIASVEYVPDVAGSSIDGKTILESADSTALTEALVDRFLFKNSGYFIESINGRGVITIAGVKLDVQTILGNYTVRVTGLTQTAHGATGSIGNTITVAEIKDVNGQIVSVDAVTAMNILTEGTVVQTNSAASKKAELTIANYAYSGAYNYILEVCFTVGGVPVSAQIPFALE